jgi:hypothetical protein
LFESADLDANFSVPLSLTDPLPEDLLRYLRIQNLDYSEIFSEAAKNGARTIVSARNEGVSLNTLIEACEVLMDGFKFPLEMLEANIAANLYENNGNKWAAAQVSIGEQRIIKKTLQKARDLLDLIVCAQCGKADNNNRRCGGCRNVVYCGTDCQKNHYKDHKVSCNWKE